MCGQEPDFQTSLNPDFFLSLWPYFKLNCSRIKIPVQCFPKSAQISLVLINPVFLAIFTIAISFSTQIGIVNLQEEGHYLAYLCLRL